MPNPARKFLLAGRGGLNLTHSEPLPDFMQRYGEALQRLAPAIDAFSPTDLRNWSEALGVETFVGSSGRIFPKAMKASPLLRAWLARLDGLGVVLHPRSRWVDWDVDSLIFEGPRGLARETPEAAVFALGGGSWPRLGSDGSWQAAFARRGVGLVPMRPANSGFLVGWSDVFRDRFAGHPLKAAAFSFAGRTSRGEAMVTAAGLEGGGVYAISTSLRRSLDSGAPTVLEIDLHPDLPREAVATRLSRAGAPGRTSMANRLRRAGLSPVAAGLLREDQRGRALPDEADDLADRIKALRLVLRDVAPIDRAISSAGGVAWDSVNPDFSLVSDPRAFVCGEMLDWEAPTGGYLLQACFATGRAAAEGVLKRLHA